MIISVTQKTSLFIALFFSAIAAHAAQELKNEPILPIPQKIELNQKKVALGEKLFNEPRLSHNNKMSCAQCHQLNNGGDDGLRTSITNSGKADLINAPTVFNSVFNFRQTWRGAFKTLELQAEADLKNPRHAATSWDELLPKLKSDSTYKNDFNEIYSEGINRESVLDAIATFEKSLITPNSRFDQYLRGNNDALTDDEKKGYLHFKQYGCIACHQGVNIGGNVFQELGLFDNYFDHRGNITKADYGLYNVTKDEEDKFVFRAPSLRNVAVTSPYLHDGTFDDLKDVIEVMAQFQLGTSIKEEHVIQIKKFLHTLTGEYKGKRLNEVSK